MRTSRVLSVSLLAALVGVTAVVLLRSSERLETSAPEAAVPAEAPPLPDEPELGDASQDAAAAITALGPQEVARIREYLYSRVDPSTIEHTVRVDGDVYDCVAALYQPAVLELERETGQRIASIPRAPSHVPVQLAQQLAANRSAVGMAAQTAVPCDPDTVPIRRITLEEVALAGGLDAYLYKPSPVPPPEAGLTDRYFHSTVQAARYNMGYSADLNLWNEYVYVSPEHSIMQMWMTAPRGDGKLQTVEAGWVKRRGSTTRLFVFYTSDGYNKVNKWNADGMVVVPNTGITLNGTWSSYSAVNGAQWHDSFMIYKDTETGDWWFSLAGKWVGYWPRSKFTQPGLSVSAATFAVGGEVYDKLDGYMTGTEMGSGQWSYSGFGLAAYIKRMKFIDTARNLRDDNLSTNFDTNRNCYRLDRQTPSGDANWAQHAFVGGPGLNPGCNAERNPRQVQVPCMVCEYYCYDQCAIGY
jgi:hypothetical protein